MRLYTDGETKLTVAFDRRVPEQAEALGYFRTAFAECAVLEAVSAELFVLHISPGVVRRGRDGEGA